MIKGREGEKWAKVEFDILAPRDGEYSLEIHNDFYGKFRPYIDLPTVLDVNDRHAKDGVAYLPLYATQAFLESI